MSYSDLKGKFLEMYGRKEEELLKPEELKNEDTLYHEAKQSSQMKQLVR